MDISNIIYYTRADGLGVTISLRELCLREGFEVEDIFYAVRDAIDSKDLLERIRRISCDRVEFEKENKDYIRFKVIDSHGDINFLKFRKKEVR